MKFEELAGKTLSNIEVSLDEIVFTVNDGTKYRLYYNTECYDNWEGYDSGIVDDINGDIKDIINTPIVLAYKATGSYTKSNDDPFTWTFYQLGSIYGNITIRWKSEIPTYYSASVLFEKMEDE